MWGFHMDELSDRSFGEVYVAGGRFVNADGKLKVSFLMFVYVPKDSMEHMFEPSTLKMIAQGVHHSITLLLKRLCLIVLLCAGIWHI